MSFNIENFINQSRIEYTKEIVGIENFLNTLEYHYFSKITLNSKHYALNSISLVLEFNCNLKLLELLSHHNIGRWGNSGSEESPLQQALAILNSCNYHDVDIEELTIFLNDTSIVIKRIYNKSISTQLNDILKQIAFNYVFVTRGLTQKPYEIFVPIFEDTIENINSDNERHNNTPKSYSEFWGIYLDRDDEASIFDVHRNTYINGYLEFLND